ncbi:hypothetical protein P8452_12716 [Trifolium repens]|nr:hypothetical protein P8452_12716 [Trifolium repens]
MISRLSALIVNTVLTKPVLLACMFVRIAICEPWIQVICFPSRGFLLLQVKLAKMVLQVCQSISKCIQKVFLVLLSFH